MIKQRITVQQLEELSPAAKKALARWYYENTEDNLAHVYIPEEVNEDNRPDGVFEGSWEDDEFYFVYPQPYKGKLKNHRGTVLPLLSIGEMIDFLDDHDLIYEYLNPKQLCDTLWQKTKALLEALGGKA